MQVKHDLRDTILMGYAELERYRQHRLIDLWNCYERTDSDQRIRIFHGLSKGALARRDLKFLLITRKYLIAVTLEPLSIPRSPP
jgi:hypothetical protein